MKNKILLGIVMFLLLVSLANAGGLLDNLDFYYGLNETSGTNARESVAGVVNGTGSADKFTDFSILGNAFNCSTADSVALQTDGAMGTDIQIISLSAWVYLYDVTGNQFLVENGGRMELGVDVQNTCGDNFSAAHFDGAWNELCSNVTATTHSWHHLVYAHDSVANEQTIYVNGQLAGTDTEPDNVVYTSSRNVVICSDYTQLLNRVLGVGDEVGIWKNHYLNQSEVTDLYNGGLGNPYPFLGISPPPPVTSVSLISPLNNTFNNTFTIQFEFNTTNTTTCNLFTDEGGWASVDSTAAIGNTTEQMNHIYSSDGVYLWNVLCDGTYAVNNRTLTIDTTNPVLVTNFEGNFNILFNQNLTGQFNFSDSNLHTINITIDDSIVVFNQTNINDVTFNFTLNYAVNNLEHGKRILNVYYADGHTAKKLKNPNSYNPSNGLFNDYMRYDFTAPYDKQYIKIVGTPTDWFDTFTTEYNKDRYNIKYKPNNKATNYNFIVESDKQIYIANDDENEYGGDWIITGEHWLDFYLPNQPNLNVHIDKITDFKVEVFVTGVIFETEELEFNSIGDLNVIEVNFSFNKVNATETFNPLILGGFPFSLNLSLFGGNFTTFPVAILDWNGTNETASVVSSNSSSIDYTRLFSALDVDISFQEINHTWHINSSGNLTNLDRQPQNVTPILVSTCGVSANFSVLNITYFNEETDAAISIDSNAYQLKISDGTNFYNQTASFSSGTNHSFCTNLNPVDVTFNWDLWGTFTLEKSGFVTRVIDIDEGLPIVISNNPTTNLSLFMITIDNSTTVKYNWLTNEQQVIDGTMRVFQCNDDGSQSLVESNPVIAGVASANIELLTQTYSYDIIIEGVLFRDITSYSRCHVESQTELTFFVDVSVVDLSDLIGFQTIQCTMNKTSNTTVTMTWEQNPENPSYVSGCINAYRSSIAGQVLVYENCSTSGNSRSVAIPLNGNTYTVQGVIEQDNNSRVCGNSVVFLASDAVGGAFGLTALFAAFLLIAGAALIFVGEGMVMVIGGAIGLIASWFLGLLILPISIITGLVIFLGFIGVIGRYTRK